GREREEAERVRAAREAEVREVRQKVRALATELDELTDSVHRDEMARAEQRMRIEQLEQRCVDELGIDPDTLVRDYGPHVPVPVTPRPPGAPGEPAEASGEQADEVETRPYNRTEQEKRYRTAERQLAQLGKVNPLALEEYAAMEER